ncbi:efflux RND transporter periplasmic adaptor subunit [Flavobacterium gawalongense]|uniref:Efflux RND transporter periplasmic adaptor subunit n=1 Tax=Flavobacterium gawalongense TaxID=2594432 RepID=A0A553BGG9_9FLAO|nr:efflux RND transporter periplasmic adaptor subunit [Flavobacterium gawalongense]TRX00007.1 efflux RND transporter periplasmic adaptor subunit [Flavobacterium gawalongense]TRX04763.1 efflux RND transporter periplasmic adaptor subunit [Flavobacterium gawalongense]TRX07349.1 efflux RND transporter periplasmic adaptor subunit [Flavobacterium gawalongense]TRX08366.1 efflux RND transporter periplasmic adaptor subunit [Flavobacterium gawalongense]TRX24445.1 efflux RND transporter periplasmic adapt
MSKNTIITIMAIVFLSSCGDKKTENETEATPTIENTTTLTDVQIKNAGIETGKIEQKKISSTLKLNGKIDVPPQNLISISVPMGGYLKYTKLLEGMHVTKGQVLCVVEDQRYIQLQEDYLLAKAKIGYAKAEFERQKELNQSKASSDKVYQQAQSEYNSLLIMVQSYGEKLKFAGINPNNVSTKNISKSINIYSPINGYVSKVNVNIGKYVNPSDILFEIVNPSDIHLALTVFEKDINKLAIGQSLLAYTNTNPEKKYPCEIILIGKDFTENRSTEMHCHFTKYDKALLPGMYMNAEIELNSKQSNVLPSNAIVNYENKNYVFVAKGSKLFEMKEVTTGTSENGFTEIISNDDLKDATIVIKGAYALLMKMKNME